MPSFDDDGMTTEQRRAELMRAADEMERRSRLRVLSSGPASPEPPPPGDFDAPGAVSAVNGFTAPRGPSADYVQRPSELRASELREHAPLLRDSVQAALEMMIRRAEGTERPIPLPFDGLGDLLGGGLWPGAHVVTGPTATGKTALALQVALCAARAGSPVLYVGLELDTAQIVTRLLSQILSEQDARPVHWSSLYLGKDRGALERAVIASDALSQLPIHVEEAPPGGWSASTLVPRVQALREAHPDCTGAPIVVLDFLQLVGPEPDSRRDELRERVGRAAYAGRQCARQHGAAVLMLSSISRAAAKELGLLGKQGELGRGDPADYVGLGKESGDIEFSADTVIALAREPKSESETQGPTLVHLAIAKQRAGAPAWFLLRFNGSWFEPAQQVDADAVQEHRESVSNRREGSRAKRREEAVQAAEAVILERLETRGPCSARDLRNACDGDDKTTDRAIQRLSDAGRISLSGPPRGGHPTWTLSDDASQKPNTSGHGAVSAVECGENQVTAPVRWGAVSAVGGTRRVPHRTTAPHPATNRSEAQCGGKDEIHRTSLAGGAPDPVPIQSGTGPDRTGSSSSEPDLDDFEVP